MIPFRRHTVIRLTLAAGAMSGAIAQDIAVDLPVTEHHS